jgi:hypothetical protein
MLEGLGHADIADYLAGEFASDGLSGEFSRMIHRRSEGNPLFMTAILDHLIQTGVLRNANGNWELTTPVDCIDPDVPESLHQMLDMELGHLDDDERQALKCASVAGQQFTVCSVAIMLEITYAEAEKKCAVLAERHRFLRDCGICELPSGVLTVQYEFRHSLYRDALYRALTIPQRVNLHRSLAEGMITYESPTAPVLAAKIALHFEEGLQYESAIDQLFIAAQIASRRYAHREALDVLEHARELLVKTGAQNRSQLERDVLTRIAETQYTLGEMKMSVSTYESLAMRAVEAGDRAAEAEVLMAISHPASFIDPLRAIAACERAATIAAETRHSTLAVRADLLAACWRILIHGWSDEAGQRCDEAVSTLLQLRTEMPAYGRLLYARVLVYRSQYEQAIENATLAFEELTGGDRLWAAPAALYAKPSALGHLGRLGECNETLARGFELAKKDNNGEWLGVLRYTSFWLKWHVSDLKGMREIARSITEAGPSGLSVQMQIQLAIAQGFAELAGEDYDSARQRFETILDRRGEGMLRWRSRMFARRGLSEAWLALGEFARARSEAEELTASVRNTRDLYMAAFAWEYSARLALASGVGNAKEDIIRALEAVEMAEIPVVAWRVHATAWDLYRSLDLARAETERQEAESIIFKIAKSLEGLDSLRDSFFSAKPVRRVLNANPREAAPLPNVPHVPEA